MSDEKNIQKIPADFYEKQLILPFISEDADKQIQTGIIHKDFVLTHPTGNYPVCGHKVYGSAAVLAGRSFCLSPAGAGTSHMGNGYCNRHDGGGLSKVTTGRYSKYLKGILADRLIDLSTDPQILSLDEEIQLLRALVTELLSMKETSEANLMDLLQNPPKLDSLSNEEKKKTLDTYAGAIKDLGRENKSLIGAIQDAIERVSKIVEVKNKVENGEKHTVRIEHLQVIVVQITEIIKKHIKDPEIQFNIGKELSQLHLPNIRQN